MSSQRRYNTFRLTFPEFVYEGYKYYVQSDGLHIAFRFRLNDSIVFEPKAIIPCRRFLDFNLSPAEYDLLVFNIGMIELVSYWKAYCPPHVRIVPHGLTDSQIAFWKKIYFNGLGEFFYTNGIRATIDDFMTIESEAEPLTLQSFSRLLSPQAASYIVPIGGGKDSVVSLELLGEASTPAKPLPLVMNPRGATVECCRVAGYGREDFIEIQRTIDPLLLDLNAKGALNGHTPFSAMLAFYTLLASAMAGRRNIALSNESSANESTVIGLEVNHQYSKTLEFENDFRSYVAENISTAFNYFSFLRPLSELQIAMLFSHLTKYHDVFRSCNVGSKQDIWCGHCPKCLFAFIILSPFIAPDRLSQIFGHNLLDDEDMRLSFRQLIGVEPTKPFECVGTVSEVRMALQMALDRWYSDQRPLLLNDYEKDSYPTTNIQLSNLDNSNLSAEELNILKRHVV